jgi:protein TonB
MQAALYPNNDRFAISMLIALVLHAIVGLGVGFVVDFKPLTHPLETLDVVLVNWRSESAPEEADFLAQASQEGGGESTEASRPSQDIAHSKFSQHITTIAQPEPPLPTAAQLRQESMTMAKLQPGVQHNREFESKLPRRKWISANTREYEFAAYMQAWVAKVERVGNLNYPEEVRRLKLVGDLIMTVGIKQDGSVESIDISRSSGLPQLDQAAKRIVRLAGPYSPLPDHISRSVDILHITRTWRFSRDFKGLN